MTEPRDHLVMWTIYDHPTDYPDCFVARKWLISGRGQMPTADVICWPTIEPIREALVHLGLTPLSRDPNDDPKIVEIWL